MSTRSPLITRRPARAQDIFTIIDVVLSFLSMVTMIITIITQVRNVTSA